MEGEKSSIPYYYQDIVSNKTIIKIQEQLCIQQMKTKSFTTHVWQIIVNGKNTLFVTQIILQSKYLILIEYYQTLALAL